MVAPRRNSERVDVCSSCMPVCGGMADWCGVYFEVQIQEELKAPAGLQDESRVH